jgi:hypothetical protein
MTIFKGEPGVCKLILLKTDSIETDIYHNCFPVVFGVDGIVLFGESAQHRGIRDD